MIINLNEINPGGTRLTGADQASIIDIDSADIEFIEPITYDLDASIVSGSLLVRGLLRTVGLFSCVRCLKKYKKEIEVASFFARKEFSNRGGTIDLTEEVREDIILALPVKPLCHQDCSGICPQCGQNLNKKKCDCSRSGNYSPFSQLNYKDLDL